MIAGQAVMTLDLRDLDAAKIARFRATFERIGREIGRATDTSFQFRDFAGAETSPERPVVAARRVEQRQRKVAIASSDLRSSAGTVTPSAG